MASTNAASRGVLQGDHGISADRRTFLKATGGLTTVALAGCTGGTGEAPDAEVDVTLTDFEIELSESAVPAGRIQFNIVNEGPSLHEFVVVDTDTPAGELPTDGNGNADESELDIVDEVEDLARDDTATLTVELEAGHYALICNLPAHYRLGMFTDFTVE